MKRLFSVNKWDKIPLKNWIEYQKVCESNLKGLDSVYKKVSALSGKELEEVKKMKVKDVTKFINIMSKPLPTRLMLRFKHNGVKYRPVIDARELTGDKYSSVKLAQSRGKYDGLHQVLFIVSQPMKFGFRKKFPFIGWKDYKMTPDEIAKGIESFKTLPMEVANPIAVFFCEVSLKLSGLLGEYSIKKMAEMTQKVKQLHKSLESDTDI